MPPGVLFLCEEVQVKCRDRAFLGGNPRSQILGHGVSFFLLQLMGVRWLWSPPSPRALTHPRCLTGVCLPSALGFRKSLGACGRRSPSGCPQRDNARFASSSAFSSSSVHLTRPLSVSTRFVTSAASRAAYSAASSLVLNFERAMSGSGPWY